ncbi:cytochrome P450 [Geodermatophilus sp. YIM 151500]|uniref:bifunctional cytochrome P450/NADPH--P450 reductase n=1 Tax=Geodermatophilus sp. YIM 151500 TaxID=2984531 RepID=UPI0021E46813|nr:cytochrome P450 [Geodermatophilus sp. YIM 151500]MCV2489319.1 cytochrome P450 [Geodermatophilus sp. YIM 151500]
MTATIGLDQIPGPRGVPLLGNILDLDPAGPILSLLHLAEEHGPIYKLVTPAGVTVVVSSPDLVAEVCDDTRFDKLVGAALHRLREGAIGAGLFTADTDDPLWRRAHDILLAPFSQQAMRDYLPRMLDVADQLMDKWSRLNPGEDVDVPADMTRLTLDTIALCGFGYRFNSFYRETDHPFVQAMFRTLGESQARTTQLPLQTRLRVRAQRQLDEDQAFMDDLVGRLVVERRAQGDAADNSDLLGRMLTGVDSAGERLPDANIRAQCVTFLVAGHETTSGLLSFATYFLVKNPRFMERARAEVDEVLGSSAAPTYEQLQRLRYVRQVLDESLRLWPTAPGFNRAPRADTVIGGRYAIPKGTATSVMAAALHRDTSVWGEDARDFDPDHMAPERLAAVPPHAYKPFGTGLRACIGRQFALQEATLVLGMLLQRFELVDHLDYQLQVKSTLTIKPADFRLQVRPRTDVVIEPTGPAAARAAARTGPAAPLPEPAIPQVARHGTRLSVLFGSNLGTAEALATRLAREGTDRGFDVTLGPLDDHVGDLPAGGALLVVCASYNGIPPDNATAFCRWIAGADADAATGVAYSVFGCGNTEWRATYQAVPTLLDTELAAHGGRRLRDRGEGNAAADFDAEYRSWHGGLWTDVATALDLPPEVAAPAPAGPRLSITLTNRQLTNPVIMSYRARPARVRANRELLGVSPSAGTPGRSTRHIEITLPPETRYRAGDHLGVLPRNRIDVLRRVLVRFGLDPGQYITIIPTTPDGHTHLPIDEPTPLVGVLASCVELQDVATRADVEVLADHTDDPGQQAELGSWTGEDEDAQARYRERVFAPNRSVLDLLEQFPACRLPFEVYLDMLPPLRPRYYSISSSPLVSPDVCSITAGVLRAPARSGTGTFSGVASTHLEELPENGTAFVFVREPTIAFRPPEDPTVPMLMVGAGTGLAPFRGFLQERAALRGQGVQVAASLLFFGCREPQADLLYAEELLGYQRDGLVRVENAFSREPGRPCRYVQDAMLDCADEVWSVLQRDAVVLVCGNASTIAPGVRSSLVRIFRDRTATSEADAAAWLAGLRAADRFVEDIWGG